MKKLVATLVSLAMILAMVSTGFAVPESGYSLYAVRGGTEPGEGTPVQSGTETVTDSSAIEFFFTPDTDGILSVTLSGNPGYKIWVYQVADDGTVGPVESGSAQATYEYELVGGVDYRVYIIGYYNWSEAAATITYEATFSAAEIELSPVDMDKSNVVLELGANVVDLLENTIVSLYDFVPAEPGIYTITVGDGVTMATYGFSTWNIIANAENGVIVHTATAAEQTILIGLTADAASVTVTIEKTGVYVPPVQNEYVTYEPSCPVASDPDIPSDLVSIDINKEQNVVLGDDGYYHLGTANGPVIYVNLNNEYFTLAALYNAGAPTTMRGIYVDENGESHYYDFMDMITGNYYEYSRNNDYHPLNKDLMIFLKAYGTSQGWYNAITSGFDAIKNGPFLEESAWLVSCYTVAGPEGIPSGSALALGDNNVVLTYATAPMMAPYWTYTATEGGYLTVTVSSINGNTVLDMPFGMGTYTLLVGEADGQWTNTATVYMNAGETVNVAVLDTMDMEDVPAVLNLSFVAGEPIVEKDPADYFDTDPETGYFVIGSLESPVDIFVGNDDIYFLYIAEADGTITLTPSVEGYEATNCAIKVNDGEWGGGAAPTTVAAGDVVIINIWSGYEGTASMTVGGDEPGGETPDENAIEIEAYGNAEWTAPEDGYVKFTINIPGATLAILNGFTPLGEGQDSVTVQVVAGTTYGIYPGFDVTTDSVVTWEYVEGIEGGEDIESIPSGGALALGDNNVSLTYATMPMMAPYWTYTATEGGYLTVTVSSINGNTMLGMPFGMGMYTLLVGEADGQWTNTATVYMNAGETVNVAVLDTMDMEDVPAVLNLSFVAGEPVVEKNPADYFDTDPETGYFVIGSLESPVDIFVGNDDIYYIYIAEADGTVTLTPSVEGYEATNCAIKVNDGEWDWNAAPATVSAGDVVIINIWGGYEGTASMTVGGDEPGDEPGGEPGENTLVQSGTETVTETGAIEFFFTPDADGILSVTLSGDPGYKIWVYRVADDSTVGLAESGSAKATYEYELVGGVEYRVYIIGYYNWGEAAATITYEATFTAMEIELPPVDMDKSEVVLELGANTVDLLENTIISLYEFIPAEPGIYTITVDGNVTMAIYGFSAWNLIANAENGVIVHTATAAEQTILIGLTAEAASATVTIEKTGVYVPPVQNEYADYEPSCPVDTDFKDPEEMESIDISKEQNVVLGEDGYYHLGTANGPIVYVKLNNEYFTLAALYDAGAPITMRGIYVDENGESHYYDFMDMITGNYYEYSRNNDYHPLNKDLMIFLKAYGQSQGWYSANTSGFEAIKGGQFLEESAWLVSCYTVAEPEDVPPTGDFVTLGAVIAMTISAICGTAIVVKKKES